VLAVGLPQEGELGPIPLVEEGEEGFADLAIRVRVILDEDLAASVRCSTTRWSSARAIWPMYQPLTSSISSPKSAASTVKSG
jgi:hypothetical protein